MRDNVHYPQLSLVSVVQRLAGDKGSSSWTARGYLLRRGIGVAIPAKVDEAPDLTFDRAAYRERNIVERLINRLKKWRLIATCYEKRAASSLAMLTVAAIRLWLQVRGLDEPGARYGVGVPAVGVAGAPTAFPAK